MTIPSNCWTYEAFEIASKVNSLLSKKDELGQFLEHDADKWKASFSFVQLSELLFTIYGLHLLEIGSTPTVQKKLKDILQMPLTVREEDINTNQGRNSLFELRLAVKFANSGYITKLSEPHPDILVFCTNRTYAIECKRIFKSSSFIRNINDAKEQLLNSSIGKNAKRGIIAISVTRALNEGGELKLSSNTVQKASIRIDSELSNIYNNHQEIINKTIPYTIPGLILDYSDIVETDKINWIQKQIFIKLMNTGSNRVINDFNKLV